MDKGKNLATTFIDSENIKFRNIKKSLHRSTNDKDGCWKYNYVEESVQRKSFKKFRLHS